MRATIKGLKLNVTVGIGIKADSIETFNKHSRDEKYHHRFDTNHDTGTGVDINANAGIEMGLDSYEGEVDLSELCDIIKNNLHDNIREQVKEQLEEQLNGKKIVDNKTMDGVEKCMDRIEKMK